MLNAPLILEKIKIISKGMSEKTVYGILFESLMVDSTKDMS